MQHVAMYADVEGRILTVEYDQRVDQLALCISWPDRRDGSPIVSEWMHLHPQQARELAEAILGHWGSSDDSVWGLG